VADIKKLWRSHLGEDVQRPELTLGALRKLNSILAQPQRLDETIDLFETAMRTGTDDELKMHGDCPAHRLFPSDGDDAWSKCSA
jgi:hypothetical protein